MYHGYIYVCVNIYTYIFGGINILTLGFVVLAFVPETREPLLRGEY